MKNQPLLSPVIEEKVNEGKVIFSPLHTHLPATSLWLLNSWQELVSMAMNHQRVDNSLLSLASLIQRPGKCFPFSL